MATIYYGADVSADQGTITWATYAANKNFVIIKAGGADSGRYTDANFSANQNGARAQSGLRIGYYFFGDRTQDAATCASYFISIVTASTGSLNNGEILALDIEGANYPQDAWAYTFCTQVHTLVGFYPFVYMSQYSPTSSPLSWPTTNPIAPLWMANYGLAATDFSETGGNAGATWGGLSAPNYHILQYSSTGTVPGVPGNSSGYTDLDSFYSPNNTLHDWDILGFNGSAAPGTLSYANSVTYGSTNFTQPKLQTIAVPKYSYDKVVYSDTLTANITTSGGEATYGPIDTTLNNSAYPIGNFSVDGGNTWADYGFIYPLQATLGSDWFPPNWTSQFWIVQPSVSPTGQLAFNVSYATGGTANASFIFHIALLAPYYLTSIPQRPSVTQSTAFSNLVPNINPPYATYRRIYLDSSGTATFNHSLGVVPNMLFWQLDTSNNINMAPCVWSSTGPSSGKVGAAVNASTVGLAESPLTQDIQYRLYYDN